MIYNYRMPRTIITIDVEIKKWLDSYSRRTGLSNAEIIRRAIRDYRRQVGKFNLAQVLQETSGKWDSVTGDSQAYVDALRTEWDSGS
jgi:predicted DNA-binding protein